MTGPVQQPPTFYLPAEVAVMLRCSEWWVKEQARQRRVPFCWIGGAYKFTAEQVAEIAQLFEVRPAPTSGPESAGQIRRRTAAAETVDGGRLRSRVPRRMQQSAGHPPAA
ncbi:hypothetical protein Val02_78010 [Virgisporangium aliadipatigenens]|uniref:Helix-turn-helix domain-containing protein n=1 Tax=Virgisporangium aliadipatigenens TaxID=741659 RepID=A0A8J3YW64_9ACTN|nr:DNA-binding protein [Virgisporangium aliadipatigenens]GIJ50915.1 hypothetical protein Val02_78010 [Virgisporangium aliadipatigenens]